MLTYSYLLTQGEEIRGLTLVRVSAPAGDWLSSWRARIMASAFEPERKRTVGNVESALPWGQLKRMFGRLLKSVAVYRLSSNLRMFGRLSESVAVYRLSEGLSSEVPPSIVSTAPGRCRVKRALHANWWCCGLPIVAGELGE